MDKKELLEQYRNKLKHDTQIIPKEHTRERIEKLEDEIKLQEYYDQHPNEFETMVNGDNDNIKSNNGKSLYYYTLDYVFNERDRTTFISNKVSKYLYAKSIKDAHNLFLRRFRKQVDKDAVIYIGHIDEVHKNRE